MYVTPKYRLQQSNQTLEIQMMSNIAEDPQADYLMPGMPISGKNTCILRNICDLALHPRYLLALQKSY